MIRHVDVVDMLSEQHRVIRHVDVVDMLSEQHRVIRHDT